MMRRPMLPRQQRGAFLPFVVLTMVSFVLVIGMVFNTGAQVFRKEKVQNAADAAALSHATLTARSMNLIAMNNTAITQAFAINVLGVTAIPVLAEMDVLAVKEQAEILQRVEVATTTSKACAADPEPISKAIICGLAAYQWGEVAAREFHLITRIARPLIDLNIDAGNAVEFGTIANALGEMNKRVAEEFPQQAAGLQAQLAQVNGIDTTPRITAAYADIGALPADLRHVTTDLPVDLVDVFDLEDLEASVGAMAPIKRTGEQGASAFPGDSRNFASHGYTNEEGPYAKGKEQAVDEIEEVKDALEKRSLLVIFTGPRENVTMDYENLLDVAWNAQSVSHRTLNIGGLALDFVQVYVLRQDFLDAIAGAGGLGNFAYDGNDLSVFATVAEAQAEGPVFPSRFNNAPGAVYAQAQAEVYNSVYPDLYTQDWKATLRRSSMLDDDAYRDKVRDSIAFDRGGDGSSGVYAPLVALMGRLDSATLRAVNVH